MFCRIRCHLHSYITPSVFLDRAIIDRCMSVLSNDLRRTVIRGSNWRRWGVNIPTDDDSAVIRRTMILIWIWSLVLCTVLWLFANFFAFRNSYRLRYFNPIMWESIPIYVFTLLLEVLQNITMGRKMWAVFHLPFGNPAVPCTQVWCEGQNKVKGVL